MLNGFLESDDSCFYSRAISGDVPSGGWPREGQSQSPHGWGLKRTWREMPISGRVSLSCSTELAHGTAGWRDEDTSPVLFPTYSPKSRATGRWVVPSHRPSPGGILSRVLVGRKGHTQTQREVSPKWTVNCLQARETCMIRTFRIGPGPWLGRDPAPAPWPLSFPCQLSRNPGQFQSLRLQPALAWGHFRGHWPNKQVNFSRKPTCKWCWLHREFEQGGSGFCNSLVFPPSFYTWGA